VRDGKIAIPLEGSATVKIIDNHKFFDDVPTGSWYEKYVVFASARELLDGTGANQFSPNTYMTRAVFITALHHLENAPSADGDLFADVDAGAYCADAVRWARASTIVLGTGGGNFVPEDGVTREQLAAILYRYAKSLGMDTSAKGDLTKFEDSEDASDWAADMLEWAVGIGLVQGRSNDALVPKGVATRAEVAVILERFIENLL
jgi:hypothetical protein